MARIPLVNPDDPDAPGREVLLAVRDQLGGDNNFFLALANNPEMLSGILSLGAAAYFGGKIDQRLTELAYLTASVANSCHY